MAGEKQEIEADSEKAVSTAVEAEEKLMDEKKLPFPRATITNIVRKNISKGKQLKGNVKDEMNLWVAKMIERIARKMNSQPYTFVNYEMLKEAIAPYENIQNINAERETLMKKLKSIREECDLIITKIDETHGSKAITLPLDQEDLPFPKATITNKLRPHLDSGKTIKGPVKKGLNLWLGKIVSRVAKKMDSYQYAYIDRSMFKESVEAYEAVGEIELEKERIIQQMESMKIACDLLIMEIDRKFRI
ncbi:MAG: hypothetical protein NTZ73_02955 [Candidatus Diapherotrites archaeon]|nr:hypothetical protein [Candidatus Diapherotrites archaeon]